MLRQTASLASLILATLLLLAMPLAAAAQGTTPLDFERDFGLSNLPDLGGAPLTGKDVVFSAFLVPPRDGAPPMLAVQADVAQGWHIYSITQPDNGPLRSEIKVDKSPKFELAGGFVADAAPEVSRKDEFWPGVPVEEHRGIVTWLAPLKLAKDADLSTLEITGQISGQLCTDDLGSCRPFEFLGDGVDRWAATLATDKQLASVKTLPASTVAATGSRATTGEPAAIGQFAARDNNPIIRGHIEPKVVAPGRAAKLVLSIEPRPGWHVYLRADEVPAAGSRPTLIALTNTSGLKPHAPASETKVVAKDAQQYYDGPATWTVQIPIPKSTQPGDYKIEGLLGYQVCSDNTCNPPSAVAFRGLIEVGATAVAGESPLGFDESNYKTAANALGLTASHTASASPAETGSQAVSASGPTEYTFGQILVLAFLGGLILNVMPCVLPVIGLKIFSFVEQSGQNRVKSLMLNVWYAAGVVSIFLVLALLAIFFRLAWGQLFQYPEFKIAMAAVIFAMGLSFIGIWEIPIPGFVGSPGVSDLESKEGYAGAFVKGGVTTLLATPCTGPLMGTALIGVLNRPPEQILGIFLAMGLGMSSPYITIGIFPEAVKFLPRPGNWTNTFKQAMGFLLVGTVVYLLTSLQSFYVVPTIALLFGLSIACWLVGDLPLTSSDAHKWTVRSMALGLVAVTALVSFVWLAPLMHKRSEDLIAKRIELDRDTRDAAYFVENKPWQLYTEKKLQWLLDHGKTVVIDFTAVWCPNCILNEQVVLKTPQTQERFLADDVYTLVADWSHRDEAIEVTAKLQELGAEQIPLIAIYSPADRENPILIPGILQADDLYAKVDAANQHARESAAVAMPISTSRTAMMPTP